MDGIGLWRAANGKTERVEWKMGELACWPDREVPSSAKRRRRASDHVHSTIAMAEARYEYKSGYGGGLKGTRTIAVGSGLHQLVVRPDPGGRRWVSCARVEFELHHLRLLCDAIAPTEKTKRIRQFVRSTPIPAGAQASDFVSLGDALTLLAVHLGDVDCFADVVGRVGDVRDVRDGACFITLNSGPGSSATQTAGSDGMVRVRAANIAWELLHVRSMF